MGVGNGDPACFDREQFLPQEESFELTAFECEGQTLPIPDKGGNVRGKRTDWLLPKKKEVGYDDDYRIVAMYAYGTDNAVKKEFSAKVIGAEGFEYIEFERLGGKAEIFVNGEKVGDNFTYRMPRSAADNTNRPYRFYCSFTDGYNEVKIISEVNESVKPHFSGYVKIGKTVVAEDQFVRLHYGKARVFVKTNGGEEIKLNAEMAK